MNSQYIDQFGLQTALPALSGFVVGIFLRKFAKAIVTVLFIAAIFVLGLLMIEEINHRPTVIETLGVIRRPTVLQNFAMLTMTLVRQGSEQLRALPSSSLIGFAVGSFLNALNALRTRHQPHVSTQSPA